ncbi:MAG: alpha/beta hydrolase [Alphaproteobacteria bacterium]|nr:alpha/beta hydrolase [Alphaproteobacteria bacterium]
MKTPVVLLPALLCNAGLFIHQIKALEETCDFFVPEPGKDTDVSAAARRILNQVPDRFILGGISMGGYIAFEIMRQAPECAAGLILMDTNARSDPPAAREKRRKMIETAQKEGIKSVISPALLDIIAPVNRNDITTHILTHMAIAMGVEKYINEQTLIMNRPESTDLLPTLSCPVLVMGGELDVLSPPAAMDEIAAQIPNSAHVIIENSGHLPPIENPAAVTAAWRLFFKQISF